MLIIYSLVKIKMIPKVIYKEWAKNLLIKSNIISEALWINKLSLLILLDIVWEVS